MLLCLRILKNLSLTGKALLTEKQSWDLAADVDKTDFAMKYAVLDTDWITPRYIEEGLRWLAATTSAIAEPEGVVSITTSAAEENADA